MGDLERQLLQHLAGGGIAKIAQQLGVDEGTAQQGVQAALPLLLGAIARNTQSPEGAQALHTALASDHDGSVLNDVEATIANSAELNAAGILGHLLGGQQGNVAQAVGEYTGVNGSALLQMLAPLVMGQLGQTQRQESLDASGLANRLGGATPSAPSNPLMGIAMKFLDQNHDGSLVDDGLKLAGQFFTRR